MLKLLRRYFFLLVIFALALSLHAELEWEDPIQEFYPGPEATYQTAYFTFRNMGLEPVSITSVQSSCGCTTTDLEKRTYAAGESGTIEARFDFGKRTGLQVKEIYVTTDAPNMLKEILELKVHIPTLLTVSPRSLYWRHEENREPKSIRVSIENDQPVHIERVESTNPDFRVILKAVNPGNEYLLTVLPPHDDGNSARTTLDIVTDFFVKDKPKIYKANATVAANSSRRLSARK